MPDQSKDARDRAEARLQKAMKADVVRKQAMSEYEAEAEARRKKTDRLRALRLEKEAVDREAAAPPPAKKARKTATKP